MNVNLGVWGKLTKGVVFLLFLAGVLGVAIWYLPLIRQNERMRKEILHKDRQIRQEEEIARQVKASTEALKHDPRAIERVAREKLSFARPGETMIRFEEPASNTAAGR